MAPNRNPPPETDEAAPAELDQESAQALDQQPKAPLMGGRQGNEGTTTDPMIKNKSI